jgi:hypothetical protein
MGIFAKAITIVFIFIFTGILASFIKYSDEDKKLKADPADLIKQYGRDPDIYILPKGFPCVMAIAFDQDDGIKPMLDASGRKIYIISDTGSFLVKITGRPDLFNYATNNLRFYYRVLKDSLVRMPVYKYYDSIPDDSIVSNKHVFLLGYDRWGRNRISSIIQGNIKFNILFLKITTDLYYNPNHFGHDNVFYLGRYYKLSG